MEEMLLSVFGHIADTRSVDRAEALTYAYALRIGGKSKGYSCLASGLLTKSLSSSGLNACIHDTTRRWLIYVWYGAYGLEIGFMEPHRRAPIRYLRVIYRDVGGERLLLTCGVKMTPVVEVFLRTAVVGRIRRFMEFCRDDETALGTEIRATIAFVVEGHLEQANDGWLGMEGPDGMVQQIWGADKWESRIEAKIDSNYRTAWGAAVAFWSAIKQWERGWEYSEWECDPENQFLTDSRNHDLSPFERDWCDFERRYIAEHGRSSNISYF